MPQPRATSGPAKIGVEEEERAGPRQGPALRSPTSFSRRRAPVSSGRGDGPPTSGERPRSYTLSPPASTFPPRGRTQVDSLLRRVPLRARLRRRLEPPILRRPPSLPHLLPTTPPTRARPRPLDARVEGRTRSKRPKGTHPNRENRQGTPPRPRVRSTPKAPPTPRQHRPSRLQSVTSIK